MRVGIRRINTKKLPCFIFLLATLSVTVLFTVLPVLVQAHPVTYKGATVVHSVSRPMMSSFEVNTTLTRTSSIGLLVQNLNTLDLNRYQTGLLQWNWRAYRKNLEHSQANLYLTLGLGGSQALVTSESFIVNSQAGFQFDWESRKHYFALMHSTQNFSGQPFQMTTLRLGLAPYEGAYQEFQTWFMLQAEVSPLMFGQPQLTPLFRFFYRNALWEIGSSMSGVGWLSLMAHF